ncbi:MAG: hypothetical protein U9Q15_03835 [Patescibacteria group bacterium]|nr:hypothetical protein [Patescibacteria group bacterium]
MLDKKLTEMHKSRDEKKKRLVKIGTAVVVGGAGYAAADSLSQAQPDFMNDAQNTFADNLHTEDAKAQSTETLAVDNTVKIDTPDANKPDTPDTTDTTDIIPPKDTTDIPEFKDMLGGKELSVSVEKGEGAIQTFQELQDGLTNELPEGIDLDNIEDHKEALTENQYHILTTPAEDLAKEYGFYKPELDKVSGLGKESAVMYVGDTIKLDADGNLVFDRNGTETKLDHNYGSQLDWVKTQEAIAVGADFDTGSKDTFSNTFNGEFEDTNAPDQTSESAPVVESPALTEEQLSEIQAAYTVDAGVFSENNLNGKGQFNFSTDGSYIFHLE